MKWGSKTNACHWVVSAELLTWSRLESCFCERPRTAAFEELVGWGEWVVWATPDGAQDLFLSLRSGISWWAWGTICYAGIDSQSATCKPSTLPALLFSHLLLALWATESQLLCFATPVLKQLQIMRNGSLFPIKLYRR